ncbi:MAG TPA: hypothetical protein VIP57_14890 [Candidatus Dormibacteraeota bacterium]
MRKKAVVVGAILLVTGCGLPGQLPVASRATNSPTSSVTAPIPSPSAVAPRSPTPVASPFPTGVGVACRLPVLDDGRPGWLTFPGGKFKGEAAGVKGDVYDWALGRWLTNPGLLAPDGLTAVAYVGVGNTPGKFFLTDLNTGVRRLILGTAGPSARLVWGALGYTGKAVYLVAFEPGSDTPGSPVPGLWTLDPKTGAVRRVDSSHIWTDPLSRQTLSVFGGPLSEPLGAQVTPDAVWGVDGSQTVWRYDARTGRVMRWYQMTEGWISMLQPLLDGAVIIGYDNSSGDSDSSFAVALLTSPGRLTAPNTWPPPPAEVVVGGDFISTVADRWGAWVATDGNVALYREGIGLVEMATSSDGVNPQVGGPCR